MQGRLFQNTLNQLKKDIKRTIGVIDDAETVIACSDEMNVGNTVDNIANVFENMGEIRSFGGYSYKRVESFNKSEYIVFCEGEDDIARNACAFLGVHFLAVKQYYDEKYDKNSFVKNMLVDNVLPGDVLYRTRELHLAVDEFRIVYLIRAAEEVEASVMDVLRNLFPDSTRDFVIRVDENDVAVVRECEENIIREQVENTAKSILDTLNTDGMINASIGISTVVDKIQDLAQAYREARIALEVGKVFDVEKNIISYDNLGIGRLIYQLPTTLCELFLKEVFKKESINVLDTETIYTIQKFFENNLNVSETSRKLFVHRNTLVYRLDKIKKLTGLDLREFDDAIIFKVAMMVNKYLTSEPTRL